MSAALPTEFVDAVAPLLGADLPAFLATYDAPATRGLRGNPIKVDQPALQDLLDGASEPVPWCPTGLRMLDEHPGVGASRAHRAGLFYLQEPSAMSPAELLAHGLGSQQVGARVADLAAAPGGKTTRLTEIVGSAGLVVANEVDGRRLGILHENLDRWGAGNVVTCSQPLDRLAASAGAVFDGVLLDAPCTGEGMFRRDPGAIAQWNTAAVRGSARRQAGLLAAAAALVRPGGVLVYSTCTFAPQENEDRIAELCRSDSDWEIEDARIDPMFASGRASPTAPTERTARLWPHHVAGEGHFLALLRRVGQPSEPAPAEAGTADSSQPQTRRRERRRNEQGARTRRSRQRDHGGSAAAMRAWSEFVTEVIPAYEGRVQSVDDRVYAEPARVVPFAPELLSRPGVPLGRARPGRFEPAQALAGQLSVDTAAGAVAWEADDSRWQAYLRGEEVIDSGPDGWVLVTAHGWGVGWARRRAGVLKNFLPRPLRARA